MKKEFLHTLKELFRLFDSTSVFNQTYYTFASKKIGSNVWTYPTALTSRFSPAQIESYLELLKKDGAIVIWKVELEGSYFRGIDFTPNSNDEQIPLF